MEIRKTIRDWFYDYGFEDEDLLEDIYNIYQGYEVEEITQSQFLHLMEKLKK